MLVAVHVGTCELLLKLCVRDSKHDQSGGPLQGSSSTPSSAAAASTSNDSTAQWRIYTDTARRMASQVQGCQGGVQVAEVGSWPLPVLVMNVEEADDKSPYLSYTSWVPPAEP